MKYSQLLNECDALQIQILQILASSLFSFPCLSQILSNTPDVMQIVPTCFILLTTLLHTTASRLFTLTVKVIRLNNHKTEI